ncbi:MAG: hypothetical protein QW186_05080 [Candidatus Bathyarchaeia archaeon]
MIPSVTTTVTTVATLAVGVALGAFASALLILFLATKEVAAADSRRPLMLLSKILDVDILNDEKEGYVYLDNYNIVKGLLRNGYNVSKCSSMFIGKNKIYDNGQAQIWD